MTDCIFCKIAKKGIPKEFTYEDDEVMVFPDIHPIKPIHLLIAPKKHIPEFVHVEDGAIYTKLFTVVQKMIKKSGLEGKRHRIAINGGGLQEIDHLHIHLMGPIE